MPPIPRRLAVAFAAALCGTAALAQAPWPSKPIRLIVPFSAGPGAVVKATGMKDE